MRTNASAVPTLVITSTLTMASTKLRQHFDEISVEALREFVDVDNLRVDHIYAQLQRQNRLVCVKI